MRKTESLLYRMGNKFTVGDGCWEWIGAKTGGGYGYITLGRRGEGIGRAHRLLYEMLVGPIPAGMELDHLCRNRACVNPGHLEPVTHKENLRRGPNAIKDTCINGHPWAENARVWGGHKKCLACNRHAMKRRAELKHQLKQGAPRGLVEL